MPYLEFNLFKESRDRQMDSEVLERLDILRNSDQIDANEYEQTLYILRYVEETYGVEVENEVGGMFAVHAHFPVRG